MRTTLLALVALAGCEKNLLPPDAAAGFTGCPAPYEPLAPGKYKLYLNTEGVTLTSGSPDSRTNTTDLVAASAVVPPFLDGVAGRQDFIAQIVTIAQGALAPYSIDIVTTRPTAGDYNMFVVGGVSTVLDSACGDCYDLTDLECSPVRDSVDLVFDHGATTPFTSTLYANLVLGGLGTLQGLASTTVDNDCECRVDAVCDDLMWSTSPCTFSSSGMTTMNGPPENCSRTTEDEPALLAAALGCR